MKLRIAGDNLRFRINADELLRLSQGKTISECIQFSPEQSLTYEVMPSSAATITVHFSAAKIMVQIPSDYMRNQVPGTLFKAEEKIDNGTATGLRIVVELDIDGRGPK